LSNKSGVKVDSSPFARWQLGFGMHSGSVDTQLSSAFSLHKRWPSSPTSTTTLNDDHISEALLKSEDNGATLDFSHRGLTDVDEFSTAQLAAVGREDPMEDESSLLRCACPSSAYVHKHGLFYRVTFASNRLATLPVTFTLLSHLRYLNLKNNCFAVFPDVVSITCSLDKRPAHSSHRMLSSSLACLRLRF
jgi:hypothetical protein